MNDGNKAAFDPGGAVTLRDYFAGKALEGLMASPATDDDDIKDITEKAYESADAMLEERKK